MKSNTWKLLAFLAFSSVFSFAAVHSHSEVELEVVRVGKTTHIEAKFPLPTLGLKEHLPKSSERKKQYLVKARQEIKKFRAPSHWLTGVESCTLKEKEQNDPYGHHLHGHGHHHHRDLTVVYKFDCADSKSLKEISLNKLFKIYEQVEMVNVKGSLDQKTLLTTIKRSKKDESVPALLLR